MDNFYKEDHLKLVWLVFTLFSLFLLAVHCVQFKILKGKLAWSLESCI